MLIAYAVLVGDTDVVSWSGGTLETGVGLEVEVESERVGDTVVDNSSYDGPHQLVLREYSHRVTDLVASYRFGQCLPGSLRRISCCAKPR